MASSSRAVDTHGQSLREVFGASKSYVTIHALDAGSLTLPASQFIEPCQPELRLTVPSLSFLIQHHTEHGKATRMLFDLGIRRDLGRYPAKLQAHLTTRQPLCTDPDVKKSLETGGLSTDDVDIIMLSHVHWDHVGTPSDFQRSHFVVGEGTLRLLASGPTIGSVKGAHSHFEPDLLPPERTFELGQDGSTASHVVVDESVASSTAAKLAWSSWKPLLHFPAALDVFGDQSLYIIQAPGHLEGHINLLGRLDENRWVYLAGDACHDRRLLTGEMNIAEWKDAHGMTCCIHANKSKAMETLRNIQELESRYRDEVEVILAHDSVWASQARNKTKFWPGQL